MDCRGMCGVCHTLYSLSIACPQAVQSGTGIETHVRYFQPLTALLAPSLPFVRNMGNLTHLQPDAS